MSGILSSSAKISRQYFFVAVAVVVAFGLGLALALATVLAPVSVDLRDQSWSVPSVPNYEAPEAYSKILESQIWELDKRALRKLRRQEKQEPESSWKLLGLISDEGTRYAVIQVNEERNLTYLKIGEQLPTGETIEDMTETTLSYADENGSSEKHLYSRN